jgi:hypothetical protein
VAGACSLDGAGGDAGAARDLCDWVGECVEDDRELLVRVVVWARVGVEAFVFALAEPGEVFFEGVHLFADGHD